MSTLLVRALDQKWDVKRGAGLSSFVADINAVAQIIAQRLKFLMGEWFENTADGTPLFQSLLGQPTTTQAVALILQQRILGSPYVTGILSLQVAYKGFGRTFAFVAVVQTSFGPLTISNNQATSGLSWSSMTAAQWETLTSGQWPGLMR